MSDAPTADPDGEPDGNRDEQTNGDPDRGGDPDRADIQQSARDAERLEGHSRPSEDAAGVNPSRSQQELRPDAG
jgi:hypothetical protein